MSRVFERQTVKVDPHQVKGRVHLDYQSVRADDRGLWLQGVLAVPRAEMASVSVALGERTTVHVRTAKKTGYSCTFTDPDDAKALLEALGRTADRTVIETALEPSLLKAGFEDLPTWKAFVVVGLAIVALFALLPFMARPVHADAGGLGALLDRTLEVGADGLRIRGRFVNGFLSYRAIAAVASRPNAIVLTMRDGTQKILPVIVAARIPELVSQIERSVAEATNAEDHEVAALLREVPGTKSERVTSLRELGNETDGSYRSARIPRERLWGIVEDPRANGATRTRAAIALSGALAEEDRERLRVATDATVSPKVRVALDAVQGENDARLAQHLDELPEEELPVDEPAGRAKIA